MRLFCGAFWGPLVVAGLLGCGTAGEIRLPTRGRVSALAFSPDGTRLASGGDDGRLRIWNADDGRLLIERAAGAPVAALAYAPDGHLAVGAWDGRLTLRDARTLDVVRAFAGHVEAVGALAFSPDGSRLASGSHDDTLRVWDVASGRERLAFEQGNEYDVTCVAFSADGRRLASGDGDNGVTVWDAGTGEALQRLPGHEATVVGVAFVDDRLVSASWDGTVRIWDLRREIESRVLRGEIACASAGSGLVAAGGEDGSVRVWGLDGHERATLQGFGGPIACVSLSPDGRRLAVGGAARVRIIGVP